MIHERLKRINRIVLSIGHDLKNVGATNDNGDNENALATDIATKAAQYLRANGLIVLLMPDLELSKTVRYLNLQGNGITDLAIEIHKDSCGSIYNDLNMERRCGLYYLAESAGSGNIARDMATHFRTTGAHVTSWARPDTDCPRKRLAFVRDTKMLAYIYEAGFIEGNNTPDENEWYAWVLCLSILNTLEKPVIYRPVNMTTILPTL
jgi:N-acetylmuramoyl-L-alanine amidase